MMKDLAYHTKADAALGALTEALEEADAQGALDMEYAGGMLTICVPSGKQLVVSKHAASGQIWLASPVSGGLHFSYDGVAWRLADGRTLGEVLSHELQTLAHLHVHF